MEITIETSTEVVKKIIDLQPTMKAKCLACTLFYTPPDCEVSYRKSLTGRAWLDQNAIAAPKPVTRKSLYIYLHECAHIICGHSAGTTGKPVYLEEFEAEMLAHEIMRESGIPVPRIMTVRAQWYVGYHIKKFQRRSKTSINAVALKFARLYWGEQI